MERDFMGLNSKDPIVIKEEFVEGRCEDSGFMRSSGVPWPWPNKPCALPQFMPLKCEQDEKSSKMKPDLLASRAHMAKSGLDIFEAMHKQQSGDIQNFGGASNLKLQFLNGISTPPSAASVVGMTEQWNNLSVSSTPAQLTIFYGGTVNVFDDITPETAQAIIFLAGNGCVQSNMGQSKTDRALVNQSVNNDHVNNDDVMVSKTIGMPTNVVVNNVEPPRMILPIRSVAASAMISSAVPQARKASLARFLEKRKERATSAAPYKLSKNGGNCVTPKSNEFGLSATSVVCSSSVSINNRD